MEFYLDTTLDGDTLDGRSRSGSLERLQAIPGERNIGDGLLVFAAVRDDGGNFSGDILAPWQDGAITLTMDGERLTGTIDNGIFKGALTAVPAGAVVPLRDYEAALHDYARANNADLMDRINESGDYSDEIAAELRKCCDGFAEKGAY